MDYIDELSRQGIDTHGEAGPNNVFVECPFDAHDDITGEIRIEDGFFYCFSCKRGVSFAEFLAEAKGISVEEARRIVKEAERVEHVVENLDEVFFGDVAEEPLKFYKRSGFLEKFPDIEGTPGQEYLEGRKLTLETMKAFGLRWGTEDEWEDRVILPVYNEVGKLVTWAGRHIDGGYPKTRKPRSGRSALYGLQNIYRPGERLSYLMPVEGEIDCMWLQQCGILAVSTMGTAALTDDQVRLLYQNAALVIFSYDNDKAGRAATALGIERMRRVMPAYSIRLPKDRDPNDLVVEEVAKIYGGRI